MLANRTPPKKTNFEPSCSDIVQVSESLYEGMAWTCLGRHTYKKLATLLQIQYMCMRICIPDMYIAMMRKNGLGISVGACELFP